jgi:hypothetical protein
MSAECGCKWIESGHAWVMCSSHYDALMVELETEAKIVPALANMLRRYAT